MSLLGYSKFRGVNVEAGSFGMPAACYTVRVLVAATLPWRVSVREEHRRTGEPGQFGVVGEFLALIPGDGFHDRSGGP